MCCDKVLCLFIFTLPESVMFSFGQSVCQCVVYLMNLIYIPHTECHYLISEQINSDDLILPSMRPLNNSNTEDPRSNGEHRMNNRLEVPDNLIAHCNAKMEEFTKVLKMRYNPDFINCSIDYFHHPETHLATPNYRINIACDLFCPMKVTDRVSAIDAVLKPLLRPPYRLSINARGSISAEFDEPRLEIEEMKRQYATELEYALEYNYPQGPLEAKMKEALVEAFDPDICQVTNESFKYGEPDNAETHFHVAVISHKFEQKSLSERKEMVKYVLRYFLPKLQSCKILTDVPETIIDSMPQSHKWTKKENLNTSIEAECWPI